MDSYTWIQIVAALVGLYFIVGIGASLIEYLEKPKPVQFFPDPETDSDEWSEVFDDEDSNLEELENELKTITNISDRMERYARLGNLEALQELVKQDVNINRPGVLQEACYGKHLHVVKYLVGELKADVKYDDSQALQIATRRNCLELVEYLVNQGADVSAGDNECIQIAASVRNLELIKYLVSQGADVHANNEETFCEAGDIEIVKYLVEECNVNPSSATSYALRAAAASGHLEIVEYLLDKGVDYRTHQEQAFRWAARNGHFEIVKLLASKGVDVRIRDDYALRWAVKNRHYYIINYLSSIGVGTDYLNQTIIPLKKLDIIKALVEKGTKITKYSLIHAIATNNIQILEYLIENAPEGVVVGTDELHVAIKNRYLEMVKYLVGRGIKPDWFHLKQAAGAQFYDIVDFLLEIKMN